MNSRIVPVTTLLLAATVLALALCSPHRLQAAEDVGSESDEPWLHAYRGPTRTDIDATTLDGKVLCGYQGWFNTPGDGSGCGFRHWGTGFGDADRARFVVDMWPEVSEYDPQDLRSQNARRLARPALQRFPQGTSAAAL